ncbi:MAG: PIG-L family deacetylase [Candidatus Omnitrophica bacterium]|nr:PIG-L family deacetylase [Candidatus Omnitrophota bacterium]
MNILAIGAHPDDIEIGCGGTLIKYAASGHKVYLLVLSDGSFGGEADVRRQEQLKAMKIMGAKNVFWGGLMDTEIANNRELILKMDDIIHKVRPDVVFLNYSQDIHQDHRAASLAGISATRYVKEVLYYEVPTTHHFEPDVFVDIQNVLDKKLRLLMAHTSQVKKTRVKNQTIIESARSCANFRGFQGRVKYAEGFMALRMIREIK